MWHVQVAVGVRVMLQCNQCTVDGLVNGTMGTVVGYDWPEGHRTAAQQPCGMQILFDNKAVGSQRGTHSPTTTRHSQPYSMIGMAALGWSPISTPFALA